MTWLLLRFIRSWHCRLLVVASGVVLVGCIQPFRAVSILNPKLLRQRPRRRWSTRTVTKRRRPPLGDDSVQERYFTQRLDHFNPLDRRVFRQRYFYSDRYAKMPGFDADCNFTGTTDGASFGSARGPVIAFLCIGGEGPPLDTSVLIDSVHCTGDMLTVAQDLHELYVPSPTIHLWALEHRYYGQSYPSFNSTTTTTTWSDHHSSMDQDTWKTSPVANENLIYLSSRQALRDIAHFITIQSTTITSMSSNTPGDGVQWIVFGGSYPGMLATWSRLQFPHLITAAIANSAPIQAQVDFPEYKDHMAKDFADPRVGGSMDCHDIIVVAHEEIAQLLASGTNTTTTSGNRSEPYELIADLFQLCNGTTLNDFWNAQLFLGDGVYDWDVQGNDPACSDPKSNETVSCTNIATDCAALLDYYETQTDPLTPNRAMHTLAWLVRHNQRTPDDCLTLDWDRTVQALADPNRRENWGTRSWLWQTCTEFGFYQTCTLDSKCPFGKGYHPLIQDVELCRRMFDIPESLIYRAVQDTNEIYGGWQLQSSRILSVTGDVDPWTELSLIESTSPNLPVHSVPGASHHFWTHAVQSTDDEAVMKARRLIQSQIREWLSIDAYRTYPHIEQD